MSLNRQKEELDQFLSQISQESAQLKVRLHVFDELPLADASPGPQHERQNKERLLLRQRDEIQNINDELEANAPADLAAMEELKLVRYNNGVFLIVLTSRLCRRKWKRSSRMPKLSLRLCSSKWRKSGRKPGPY
jgi:hypothetical protein